MIARTRLGVLALVVVLASLAPSAAPSPASAATYDVSFCNELPGEPLFVTQDPAATMQTSAFCNDPNPRILQTGGGPLHMFIANSTSWTLSAPNSSIRITSLSADMVFAGPWTTATQWHLTDARGDVLGRFDGPPSATNPLPATRRYTFPVPAPVTGAVDPGAALNSVVLCPNATCASSQDNPTLSVTFTNSVATVEDDNPPTLSSVDGLQPGATVSGTQEVSFSANDPGSGVATMAVLVDGTEIVSVPDRNGGKCTPDLGYHFLAPCKQVENNVRFPINTRLLADGTHSFQVRATDAAGQPTTSGVVTVTTRNAPTLTAPPTIQGTPKLGATLTATNGTWGGTPPASQFTHQWLRCPPTVSAAGGSGCASIGGATNSQYALTSIDIYQRIEVRVTASNGAVTTTDAFSAPVGPIADANGRTTPPSGGGGGNGGGGGGSGGGGGGGGGPVGGTPDTTAPVLGGVSLTQARFHVARARTAIAALVRGTLLRLTSSEGGRLSIAVQRVLPGRRSGRVCRVVSRPVRRGACSVVRGVATLTRMIGAGRSSVALSGRIGARALAPGSYRLVLTVRDGSANVSKAVTRSFTILRG